MYRKIILVLFFFIPHSCFAMELAQGDEQCLLVPEKSQVLNLVLGYIRTHKLFCAVAATSKTYNAVMRALAQRAATLLRKYSAHAAIAQRMSFRSRSLGALVGRYSPIRYEVCYCPDSELLIMEKLRLGSNDKIYQKKKKFPGFVWPLLYRPRPFFLRMDYYVFMDMEKRQ